MKTILVVHPDNEVGEYLRELLGDSGQVDVTYEQSWVNALQMDRRYDGFVTEQTGARDTLDGYFMLAYFKSRFPNSTTFLVASKGMGELEGRVDMDRVDHILDGVFDPVDFVYGITSNMEDAAAK